MTYSLQAGVSRERIGKFSLFFIALTLAITSTLAIITSANAAPPPAHTFEFTQAELDDNWEADRRFPTDGANSVSAFERNNVARLGVNSEETADGTFQRTEGIKTVGGNNFGNAVAVDLYVDEDWEDKAVRAGLWVVGDNGSNARDNLFGIVEFVNLEPSDEGASAQGDHEGWRIWSSATGLWTDLDTDFNYGEWHTLTIELDDDNNLYKYFIGDEEVGTAAGGSNFLREAFLNSYNYGLDEFPNLSNESYAAHWHGGLVVGDPVNKDDCKQGGFEAFGFRNQGLCIQYVNTGRQPIIPADSTENPGL
jgi:hypothetical protein